MQRRIRILLVIMLAALGTLLGLQTYLSVADYHRKKVVFTNDLDSLLHKALQLEFNNRLDTLSRRFLQDLAAIDLYRKSLHKTHHSRIRITADTESATRRSRAQNLSAGTYLGR